MMGGSSGGAMRMTVDVYGNVRPLERSIKQAAASFNQLGSRSMRPLGQGLSAATVKADEFTKSLDASNARVMAFGASAGVIYGVVRAMKELVNATVDVEKNMAEMNVLLRQTGSNLKRTQNELFDIARATGQSFAEVSEAAKEFARQGLGTEEMIKRVNAAMALTRLSGQSTADSIKTVTAALNTFTKEALTASEVVNKMANVDAAFAVSMEDLSSAISRGGAVAASAGVKFDQFMGMVAAAQQTTARGGKVIGNAFKTIFIRLQRPTVLRYMEELGLQTKAVAGQAGYAEGELLSLKDRLKILAKAYDGASNSAVKLNEAQKSKIATMSAGLHQVNVFIAMLSDLAKQESLTERAIQISSKSRNEAFERLTALQKTLSHLMQETKASLVEMGEALGSLGVSNLLKDVFTTIKGMAEGLKGFTEEGSKWGTALRSIFKGIGEFLSGPGFTAALLVLGKMMHTFAQQGIQALGSIAGINNATQRRAVLEKQVSNILSQEVGLLAQVQRGEITRAQAAAQVLATLQAQTAQMQLQSSLGATTMGMAARGLQGSRGYRTGKVPNFAATGSGGVPNFAMSASIGDVLSAARAEKAAGYSPMVGYTSKTGLMVYGREQGSAQAAIGEHLSSGQTLGQAKAASFRSQRGMGRKTVPHFAMDLFSSPFMQMAGLAALSGGLNKLGDQVDDTAAAFKDNSQNVARSNSVMERDWNIRKKVGEANIRSFAGLTGGTALPGGAILPGGGKTQSATGQLHSQTAVYKGQINAAQSQITALQKDTAVKQEIITSQTQNIAAGQAALDRGKGQFTMESLKAGGGGAWASRETFNLNTSKGREGLSKAIRDQSSALRGNEKSLKSLGGKISTQNAVISAAQAGIGAQTAVNQQKFLQASGMGSGTMNYKTGKFEVFDTISEKQTRQAQKTLADPKSTIQQKAGAQGVIRELQRQTNIAQTSMRVDDMNAKVNQKNAHIAARQSLKEYNEQKKATSLFGHRERTLSYVTDPVTGEQRARYGKGQYRGPSAQAWKDFGGRHAGTAMFAAPIIGSMAKGAIGDETRGQRIAGAAAGGLGNTLGYAGMGFMMGGPWGAAAGAAIGGLQMIGDIAEAASDNTYGLAEASERAQQSVEELTGAIQRETQSRAAYEKALGDKNMTPKEIGKRRERFIADMSSRMAQIKDPGVRKELRGAQGDMPETMRILDDYTEDMKNIAVSKNLAENLLTKRKDQDKWYKVSQDSIYGGERGAGRLTADAKAVFDTMDLDKLKKNMGGAMYSEFLKGNTGNFWEMPTFGGPGMGGGLGQGNASFVQMLGMPGGVDKDVLEFFKGLNSKDLAGYVVAFRELMRNQEHGEKIAKIYADHIKAVSTETDKMTRRLFRLGEGLEKTQQNLLSLQDRLGRVFGGRQDILTGRKSDARSLKLKELELAQNLTSPFLNQRQGALQKHDFGRASAQAQYSQGMSELLNRYGQGGLGGMTGKAKELSSELRSYFKNQASNDAALSEENKEAAKRTRESQIAMTQLQAHLADFLEKGGSPLWMENELKHLIENDPQYASLGPHLQNIQDILSKQRDTFNVELIKLNDSLDKANSIADLELQYQLESIRIQKQIQQQGGLREFQQDIYSGANRISNMISGPQGLATYEGQDRGMMRGAQMTNMLDMYKNYFGQEGIPPEILEQVASQRARQMAATASEYNMGAGAAGLPLLPANLTTAEGNLDAAQTQVQAALSESVPEKLQHVVDRITELKSSIEAEAATEEMRMKSAHRDAIKEVLHNGSSSIFNETLVAVKNLHRQQIKMDSEKNILDKKKGEISFNTRKKELELSTTKIAGDMQASIRALSDQGTQTSGGGYGGRMGIRAGGRNVGGAMSMWGQLNQSLTNISNPSAMGHAVDTRRTIIEALEQSATIDKKSKKEGLGERQYAKMLIDDRIKALQAELDAKPTDTPDTSYQKGASWPSYHGREASSSKKDRIEREMAELENLSSIMVDSFAEVSGLEGIGREMEEITETWKKLSADLDEKGKGFTEAIDSLATEIKIVKAEISGGKGAQSEAILDEGMRQYDQWKKARAAAEAKAMAAAASVGGKGPGLTPETRGPQVQFDLVRLLKNAGLSESDIGKSGLNSEQFRAQTSGAQREMLRYGIDATTAQAKLAREIQEELKGAAEWGYDIEESLEFAAAAVARVLNRERFKAGKMSGGAYGASVEADMQDKVNKGTFDPSKDFGELFTSQFARNFRDNMQEMKDLVLDLTSTMKSEMGSAFESWMSGSMKARDALKGMFTSIMQTMLDASVKSGMDSLFAMTMGPSKDKGGIRLWNKGGLVPKYQRGGRVRGGSGVKDDVLAQMQGGEYVMRKSAAQRLGYDNLDKMNQGGMIRGFAGGGVASFTGEHRVAWNDPKKPTMMKLINDPRMSAIAKDKDSSNPQIQKYYEREAAFYDYKHYLYERAEEHRLAMEQFKRQKKNRVIGAAISGLLSVGGAMASQAAQAAAGGPSSVAGPDGTTQYLQTDGSYGPSAPVGWGSGGQSLTGAEAMQAGLGGLGGQAGGLASLGDPAQKLGQPQGLLGKMFGTVTGRALTGAAAGWAVGQLGGGDREERHTARGNMAIGGGLTGLMSGLSDITIPNMIRKRKQKEMQEKLRKMQEKRNTRLHHQLNRPTVSGGSKLSKASQGAMKLPRSGFGQAGKLDLGGKGKNRRGGQNLLYKPNWWEDLGLANGGSIGGTAADVHPAMLMGGEYVLNRDAVENLSRQGYGVNFLNQLNQGGMSPAFGQAGGLVGEDLGKGSSSPAMGGIDLDKLISVTEDVKKAVEYGNELREGSPNNTSSRKEQTPQNTGSGGTTNNISISVNVASNGDSKTRTDFSSSSTGSPSRGEEGLFDNMSQEDGKKFGQIIESSVLDIINREQRPFGLLSKEKYE
jgi:TP901 family phage tail tape measure protein